MNFRNFCIASALCLAASANAALFDRGNGMIYDSLQDVTWLQDGNYAATSGYEIPPYAYPFPIPAGHMSMDQQLAWAGSLTVGGFTDWRLPRAVFAPAEYLEPFISPVSSELYTLYQQLGHPPTDETTVGPFFNIQGSHYVVGSFNGEGFDLPLYPIFAQWGQLGRFDFQTQFYEGAWAVRDGDVLAAIPEPSTYALMLAGLCALGWAARRRRKRGNSNSTSLVPPTGIEPVFAA